MSEGGEELATVTGWDEVSGDSVTYTGDAVIITVPLPVLRQMNVPFSPEKHRAIAAAHYIPVNKIALRCRTSFWKSSGGHQGGMATTDLPIGKTCVQLTHHPAICLFVLCVQSVASVW